MNRAAILSMFSVGLIAGAAADQLPACNRDASSAACQHYLEGVVDGALMYKPGAAGQRIEIKGYESRALKYRTGKRFELANRDYCQSRLPDRSTLINALAEAFEAGNIPSRDDLSQVVYHLLDCQRLN